MVGGGRRLFGTDGVRGTANVEPMTSETALRLGRALAHVSKRSHHRHKILIGKDTRLSGYMLETAMSSGICSMGVDVLLVGPMPTPGIAFLTRTLRADAGVVISASHNPFPDNGIKFFSQAGFKLPDELEEEIEHLVLGDSIDALRPTATEIGKAFRIDDAVGRYNVFVKSTFPRHLTLDGLRIVVDCGHGAAYKVGPEVLEELGADVVSLGVDPDGSNINQGCGALFPEGLQAAVRRHGAHAGLALDGDADRAIFVDEQGQVVDGDAVMAILADDLRARGELKRSTLVATVMSNLGLHLAMRERGIEVVTTPRGRPLSELHRIMRRLPQVLLNVRVAARRDVPSVPPLAAAITKAERALGARGRVLVRYSGTEPVLRVMVEGEQEEEIRDLAESIAAAARGALGESAAAAGK